MKNLFFNWLILSLICVFSSHAQVFVSDATGNDANSGLSLVLAKKTITAGIAAASNGQTISIAGGNYIINSTIVINKQVKLLGLNNSGSAPFNPLAVLTLSSPATTILQVASSSVTIQNLYLRLNGTGTSSSNSKQGIFVDNHGINQSYDNLLIDGNWIENINPTPATVDFEAYGIRLTNVALNQNEANNNIRIFNNLIFSVATNAVFGRAIRTTGNYGQIRNNVLTAFYGVQSARLLGGNLVVKKNTFNGIGDTGIEINIPYQPNSIHDIDSNTFNSVAGTTPVSMIEIKDNNNQIGVNSTINIRNNTFTNFPNFGVFLGHSQNVNVLNNVFTPLSTSTNFVDVFVNTKHRTIDAYLPVTVSNIVIQGNTLNGTTTPAGFGILFANHFSGSLPAFQNITIGGSGAGQANTFAQNLGTFISLDPQTVGSSTSIIPTTLWQFTTPTTTKAVNSNFDAINNFYNVGSGNQLANSMSKPNLMLVENKISHGIDYDTLGFVRIRAKSVFVTPASFLPGFTSVARIRRGTDRIIADNDTINIAAGTYTQDVGFPPTTLLNTNLQAVSGLVTTPNWVMNGAGKTLNLLSDLTISNQVIFTNGNIQTNANTLVFTPTAIDPAANPTTVGEKDNSYILGRAQTVRSVGTGVIDFLGVLLPAGADLGTLDLLRTSGPAGRTIAGANTSIDAKWSINPSVVNSRNNVVFRWLPAINNGKLPGSLSSWRFGGPLWVKESSDFAAVFISPLFVSIPLNLVQLIDWTISDLPNPLPLLWISVKAEMNEKNITEISWTTIQEKNTSHFVIERSLNNKNFEQIGKIPAVNINKTNNYSFQDFNSKNAIDQPIYYRIKQVDQNLEFSYSDVVKLSKNEGFSKIFEVYPNPSKDRFAVKFADAFDKSGLTIKVYDLQSRLILEKSFDNQNAEIVFDHNLPNGMYMIICQNNKSRQTARIVVK